MSRLIVFSLTPECTTNLLDRQALESGGQHVPAAAIAAKGRFVVALVLAANAVGEEGRMRGHGR